MKTISLEELRMHLGAHIRALEEGEPLFVTRRGKVVARLQAVPPVSEDDPFYEMVLRGEVTSGKKLSQAEKKKLYARRGPSVLRGITAAEILDELREDTVLPLKSPD